MKKVLIVDNDADFLETRADHLELAGYAVYRAISLDEAELSFVRQAIQRSGGNQTRAAELLGISREQLRYRLKKLEDAEVSS